MIGGLARLVLAGALVIGMALLLVSAVLPAEHCPHGRHALAGVGCVAPSVYRGHRAGR